MGVKIQLFEVGAYSSNFCLWEWMKSEVKKKKVKSKNWSLALWIVLPSLSFNGSTASGELHVLLPRGLKRAMKSMVGFLNTYFELSQFIEIIYTTNKCNPYVICLSFILFVRLFMRNIQKAVSPHPLKTGHMSIRTELLGIVHTTTS
jgi:hypothetical protein